MKIKIIDPKESHHIQFILPNSLIMNKFILRIGLKYANQYTNEIHLDEKQILSLIKELKNSVKTFGHYDLVDIESKDGEIIKISL